MKWLELSILLLEKNCELNELNLSARHPPFCTSGKYYKPEEICPEKYKNNPEKLNLEKQENDQENKYTDVNSIKDLRGWKY